MTEWAAVGRWWRPANGIILLIPALLAISFVITLSVLHEPEARQVVHELQCHSIASDGRRTNREQAVRLPYSSGRAATRSDGGVSCRFDIDLTEGQLADVALLIPYLTDSVAVSANGQRVAGAERFLMRNLNFVTLPAFVVLPRPVVRAGLNHFEIALSARPGHTALMGPLYFGPQAMLRPAYQIRWFVAAALPTLVAGGQIALAILFGLVWATRRRDAAYGWLAALLALGAVHGSVLVPDFGLGSEDYAFWNMLVLWETAALLMFMRAVAGVPGRRLTWLLAVPPGLLWVLYFLDAAAYIPKLIIRAGMVMMGSYVLLGFWTLLRASFRGNREALVLFFGVLALCPFLAHDFLIVLGNLPGQPYLARAGVSGWMTSICVLMTLRFVGAMRAVDRTAESLRVRVAEVEEELRGTYEELRVRREAEAIERERARLMRDLHDGVGGELATMLALADSPGPHGAEIAVHARAALADMRLIIGSLEDYGGDLALALGAWRERAGPQVRAAGLKLTWRVRDLPTLPGLGPAQVLDVLRIVQEGVTNVIKHARAERLTVDAFETKGQVVIAVRDDGPGPITKDGGGGNGLRNMALRAARLGAVLTFSRTDGATELRLTLPCDGLRQDT